MNDNDNLVKQQAEKIQKLEKTIADKDQLIAKMRRVPVERANAERGIPNKKSNPGFIILSSTAHFERLPSDPEYGFPAWKTIIEIPYKISEWMWEEISIEVREELAEKIFPELTPCITVDASDDIIFHVYKFVKENLDTIYIYRVVPRMNNTSGFWEVTVFHTQEIRIPAYMLPPKKEQPKKKSAGK